MSNTVQNISDEAKQRFSALFGTYEGTMNGQKEMPIHQIRKQAMKNLAGLEFPTLRHEDWKYTSVSKILQPKYTLSAGVNVNEALVNSFEIENSEAYRLVFVNGELHANLSKIDHNIDGLTILSIEEAFKKDAWRTIIEREQKEKWNQSEDAFVQLNAAFIRNGAFIHVAEDVQVDKPIHILHLSISEGQPVLAAPVQIVILEKGSKLDVIESFRSPDTDSDAEPVFTTCLNHMIVKENASLKYYKIQIMDEQFFMIHNSRIDQYRDSSYTTFTLDLGGGIIRNNLNAIHHGSNLVSNIYGIYLGRNEQHIDNQTIVDHAKPHCLSNEWYKGILTDRSRGVFNGKVYVRQDAQKTNAFQQNNTLVLSDFARMDTKPQLEIFADDVKCSHGATIGQLNEDAIFYLRTRGLSYEKSMSILQLAFLREVTSIIDVEKVRDYIEQLIAEKFNQ